MVTQQSTDLAYNSGYVVVLKNHQRTNRTSFNEMAVDLDDPRRSANESSGYRHFVAFAFDLDLDEIGKVTSYILFRLKDAHPKILSQRRDVHLIDVGAASFFEKPFQCVARNG